MNKCFHGSCFCLIFFFFVESRSRVAPRLEPAYKAGSNKAAPSALSDLRYGSRLWAGSLKSWCSRRAQQWQDTFGPEEVVLPADDWSVCTLLEKTREGGSVYRYRFGLKVNKLGGIRWGGGWGGMGFSVFRSINEMGYHSCRGCCCCCCCVEQGMGWDGMARENRMVALCLTDLLGSDARGRAVGLEDIGRGRGYFGRRNAYQTHAHTFFSHYNPWSAPRRFHSGNFPTLRCSSADGD